MWYLLRLCLVLYYMLRTSGSDFKQCIEKTTTQSNICNLLNVSFVCWIRVKRHSLTKIGVFFWKRFWLPSLYGVCDIYTTETVLNKKLEIPFYWCKIPIFSLCVVTISQVSMSSIQRVYLYSNNWINM